jgi:hypothetical protein
VLAAERVAEAAAHERRKEVVFLIQSVHHAQANDVGPLEGVRVQAWMFL